MKSFNTVQCGIDAQLDIINSISSCADACGCAYVDDALIASWCAVISFSRYLDPDDRKSFEEELKGCVSLILETQYKMKKLIYIEGWVNLEEVNNLRYDLNKLIEILCDKLKIFYSTVSQKENAVELIS